jgi:hypothetical protein
MRQLRLLIVAVAIICVLALAVLALVSRPSPQEPGDDDIIIKGGSLDVDCGKNHGTDCFGGNQNQNKPKHQKPGKIVRIVVQKSNGDVLGLFTKKDHFTDGKPVVIITYREPLPTDN